MATRASVSLSPDVLRQIEQAVRSIRYGTVQVTVHDARVVQIDKLEKVRIALSADLPVPRPKGAGTTGSDHPTTPTEAGTASPKAGWSPRKCPQA